MLAQTGSNVEATNKLDAALLLIALALVLLNWGLVIFTYPELILKFG